MLNLSKTSGLPLKLDKNKQLIFGREINLVKPGVRKYHQIKPVLMSPHATSAKRIFYYMYRNVCLKEHSALLSKAGLNYDITVIPAGLIGNEYPKTLGHFHAQATPKLTYPEVYEVLYGEGHYLLQKKDTSDFIFIKAKAGDKVIVPPNYGHVSINAGKNVLVEANWRAPIPSKYKAVVKKKGFMYYDTTEGFIKNKNYPFIPELREAKPTLVKEFGLSKKPMYFTPIEKLDFLKNPQKYLDVLKRVV